MNLTPTSTAVALPESLVPGVAPVPQIEQVQPTLTVDPADGVSMLPLSSTARDLMVALGLPCADPAVGPARRPGGRVPGGAAVGGDLDAGDHAAGVRRGAADGDLGAVTDGRAAERRRDRRGRRGRVGRRGGGGQPGDQRGRLHAHVGEQVHRRLLHVPVRSSPLASVEPPRPLHGARAEHQRAAGGAVQRQVVGGGAVGLDVLP